MVYALTDILANQIEDFIKDRVMADIWPQKIIREGGIKRQVCDNNAYTADEIADSVNDIDFTGLAELDNIIYAMDSEFDYDDNNQINREFTDAYPEIAKCLRNRENVASQLYSIIMDEDGWTTESLDIVRDLENELENNK